MSKAVLMALSPYWYYLIGEGIKTEEVRKTIPRALDWNKQVECYMTKDEKSFKRIPKWFQEKYRAHIGKVGMKFTCNEINLYEYGVQCPQDAETYFDCYEGYPFDFVSDERHCLSTNELYAYGNKKPLSSWHISDLVIYDKPRELGEFRKPCKCFCGDECTYNGECKDKIADYNPDGKVNCYICNKNDRITRPFQSWGYVAVN